MVKIFLILVSLALGQLLSIFICGTAISSEYLVSKYSINIPLSQNFMNYFLLAMVYGFPTVWSLGVHVYSLRQFGSFFRERGWKYILAAILDVEGNFLIVMAYQYTSVTSVQLLDCITIPTAMIVSLLLLKVRYLFSHYVGVAFCLCGVALMIGGDFSTKKATFKALNPLVGNIMVVFGSIFYGCSNVWQEYLIREYPLRDYLGFVGIFGCLLNGAQCLTIEWRELTFLEYYAAQSGGYVWLWLVVYVISVFCFTSLMPVVMQRTSAVLVNLSLTTADVYALLAGLILFGYQFHWLYFLGYVCIMIGVIVFVSRPAQPRIVPPSHHNDFPMTHTTFHN